MPSAGKFEEVPLGKWADYEETYLDAVTIKERVALVAREGDVVTLETTTETGTGDKTVFATVFAASNEGGWRSVSNVFQVGDEDPMESPAIGPAQQPYPAVDPKKLIGTEMISVRAGLFARSTIAIARRTARSSTTGSTTASRRSASSSWRRSRSSTPASGAASSSSWWRSAAARSRR